MPRPRYTLRHHKPRALNVVTRGERPLELEFWKEPLGSTLYKVELRDCFGNCVRQGGELGGRTPKGYRFPVELAGEQNQGT